MTRLLPLTVLCLAAGCAIAVPPEPPKPREATTIKAPFVKVWNATIDEFAASNIPIKTMDRASGFIATDALAVSMSGALNYADCGSVLGTRQPTDQATYNVVIRGDSAASTIRTTVRFTRNAGGSGTLGKSVTECSSSGYWEKGFEDRIQARAEGRPPA